MRIQNLLLNNTNLNTQEETIKEGMTLKAIILDIVDEFVLIDIKGHGVVKAILDAELGALKGEEISFEVKSLIDNKMELKPLINNEDIKKDLIIYENRDNPASVLLKNLNIKESKSSLLLVENLMNYKVHINENNLNDAIKTLEKLLQLTNLTEGDKVVLVSEVILEEKLLPNLNKGSKENIIKSFKENSESNLLKQNILENTNKEDINIEDINIEDITIPEKVNIKNLLVVNKDRYPEKEDITALIKELLGNNIENQEEFIKTISFFIKNNIKPSLNNIKNFKELNEDPIKFSKSFEKINLLVNDFKNEKKSDNFKNLENNIDLSKENVEKNRMKIEDLQKTIKDVGDKNLNVKNDIKNLENKIDFLRDMNKDLSFLFLPINFGKKDLEGALTVLKGKKKKDPTNNKTNIFINLNTDNLGNIKISCQAISNSLSVKINIKKEDLKLFQTMEKQLIEKVSYIGYIIDNIDFVSDTEVQIVDSMASNSNPTYFLDIKV